MHYVIAVNPIFMYRHVHNNQTSFTLPRKV